MTRFALAVGLALALLPVVPRPARGQALSPGQLKDWLEVKLPAAVRPLYRADSPDYMAEAVFRSETITDGKPAGYTLHVLTKLSGANAVVANYTTDLKPKGADSHAGNFLSGINPRYVFKLERTKRNDGWVLREVQANDETLSRGPNSVVEGIEPFRKGGAFGKAQDIPLRSGDTPPENLARVCGFVVTSASEAGDKLTLLFRYAHGEEGKTPTASDCRVVYDLAAFGLPVEFSERGSDADTAFLKSVNFTLTKDSERRYTRVIARKSEYKKAGKIIYSDTSDGRSTTTLGRLPESEFTASAFGLPEPPGFEPKSTPLYVWLLAAAGGCFALVALFRWLGARRRDA